MKERPILFSGPMVNAILAGHKTQTRRIVKPQPIFLNQLWRLRGKAVVQNSNDLIHYCPYGFKNDKLWVRETWRWYAYGEGYPVTIQYRDMSTMEDKSNGFEHNYDEWIEREWKRVSDELERKNILYNEEGDYPDNCHEFLSWRPSIFMPRWASRITLEITDVRIERIQDISENDIIAEGIEPPKTKGMFAEDDFIEILGEKFTELWDSINAKRGFGWDVDPWVWVIEFKNISGEK